MVAISKPTNQIYDICFKKFYNLWPRSSLNQTCLKQSTATMLCFEIIFFYLFSNLSCRKVSSLCPLLKNEPGVWGLRVPQGRIFHTWITHVCWNTWKFLDNQACFFFKIFSASVQELLINLFSKICDIPAPVQKFPLPYHQ